MSNTNNTTTTVTEMYNQRTGLVVRTFDNPRLATQICRAYNEFARSSRYNTRTYKIGK